MLAEQTQTAMSRYRFTATDYERMIAAGILAADDRLEMIAGEIVTMSPIGARNVACVMALTELLSSAAAGTARVGVQNPILLPNNSVPQPDITVVRRRSYTASLPTVADVLLVVEVADSSLGYDRATKLPLYAAAGIPEAWLIDLAAETIERHTEPRSGRYRLVAHAGPGDTLPSLALPALFIAVDVALG